MFREDNGKVLREVTDALKFQHEEANVRLVFRLDWIIQLSLTSTVSVRSNNTDVLVLVLCYAGVAHNSPNIWMDMGLSSKNTRQCISVPKLVDELDHTILQALPKLHEFPGTDFTTT